MHFKIDRAALAPLVARALGAVSEKSMGSLGLRVLGDELTVSSVDRVLAIYTSTPCSGFGDGTAFVPAKVFSDMVRELPPGELSLETSGASITVSAGARNEFRMKLPLKDVAEWQEPPELGCHKLLEIEALRLAYMIDQTQYCLTSESPRHYGTVGFLHEVAGEGLRLVATDGYRLSHCDLAVAVPSGFLPKGICVTKKTLAELSRMCHEGFEHVSFSISEDQTTLCASVDGYSLYAALSNVLYPSYEDVLPSGDGSARLKLERPMVQAVAKRVLLAAGKSRALELSYKDRSLTLSSRSAGSSEGREELVIEEASGAPFQMSVNGRYLSEVFAATESKDILMEFGGGGQPVVMLPVTEPKGCHTRHVLVPISNSD